MKAAVLFTGSGPIVILTSFDSFTNPVMLKKLAAKGIKKFLVFEIPLEIAKEKYGHHFDAVIDDLHQKDDCRVLDYDGHHILSKFSFAELGRPAFYEG